MQSFSPLVSLDATSDDRPFSTLGEVVPFKTLMEIVNFQFRQSGQHRFSYDYETLAGLLKESGFEEVVQGAFRTSRMPALNIDSESRAPESLVVEAASPAI